MNILEQIVVDKKQRLELQKQQVSFDQMVQRCENFRRDAVKFSSIFLPGRLSLIAEMKRKSPSAGLLMHPYFPEQIAQTYAESGARALSVLTEENYFGGSLDDLQSVQKKVRLPILRKDFLFDPYQIYESYLAQASAVLLVLSILSAKEYRELLYLAHRLGLETLVEVHSETELETALKETPTMIGVNNRNLKDLSIDIQTTLRLLPKIPSSVKVVSESGIKDAETVSLLRAKGVSAALVGESILRSKDIREKVQLLVAAAER